MSIANRTLRMAVEDVGAGEKRVSTPKDHCDSFGISCEVPRRAVRATVMSFAKTVVVSPLRDGPGARRDTRAGEA
jgi:hypothetical protein